MATLEELPAEELHAAPDWANRSEDLHCPLCEYNLRGLQAPRCPECGYRFEWAELLDRDHPHPYLFEHHPHRNTWSFWRTLTGGFRPIRFWKSLSPAYPGNVRRLLAYWLIVMFLAAVGAAAPYAVKWTQMWMEIEPGTGGSAENAPGTPFIVRTSNNLYLKRQWEDVYEVIGPWHLAWLIWAAAWPWLTFLTLMLFQASLRRARMKPIHVLRAVLYSGDALAIAGVLLGLLTGIRLFDGVAGFVIRREITPIALTVIALFIVIRLGLAYVFYLRFRHAWSTVIASQIIVGLIGFIAMMRWSMER